MTVLERLRARFGPGGFSTSVFRDNQRVHVPADRLYDVLAFLKADCGFDMLTDITAIDYLEYPDARDRFGIIYALLNTAAGERGNHP